MQLKRNPILFIVSVIVVVSMACNQFIGTQSAQQPLSTQVQPAASGPMPTQVQPTASGSMPNNSPAARFGSSIRPCASRTPGPGDCGNGDSCTTPCAKRIK